MKTMTWMKAMVMEMDEDELWVIIPNTRGRYEVSNLGRVRNTRTGMIRNPVVTPRGYLRIYLPFEGIGYKNVFVHRLVGDAFCYRPEGANVINHIDNNQLNNRADNLEWTTQLYNVRYAMKQGRQPNFPNSMPVIGIKDGKAIRFESMNEAANETGCYSQCISMCCNGKRKHHHGYVWKFAEVV